MPELYISVKPEDAACDFCGEKPVIVAYPSADFQAPDPDGIADKAGVTQNSKGAWAACQTCTDLIEAGEYERLTERSFVSFPWRRLFPETEWPMLKESLRRLHQKFREFRTGPRDVDWKAHF